MRESKMMETTDTSLRKSGHRLTPQRYMILQVIKEAERHLSMEQIIQRVQERNPCVSQATVYRSVDLLQTLGLVHATCMTSKHVYCGTLEGQAHHHFLCRRCHSVLHLDPDLLGNLSEQLKQHYGIEELTLELLASGYCRACWQGMQPQPGQNRRK
jgi:Fe2+ or Zn2+ uptake regulation protein